MENMCRLCLSFSNGCLHNFSDDRGITQNIQTCFSIKVECNSLLPNQICELCLTKINEACDFKNKIIENERILLEHLKYDKDINHLNQNVRSNIQPKSEYVEDKENSSNNIPINIEEIKQEFDEAEETYTSDNETLSKLNEDKFKLEINNEEVTKTIIETHKCLTCFQILDTQTDLIKHYKSVHFKKKDNDKSFDYSTQMCDKSTVYKCNMCSKEYSSKKNIHRHLIGHSDFRPYLCKICGRTYKTVSEIIRHGRVHSEVRLYCSHQCGYSTVYLGALRSHEKRHDKTEYKYKCDICGKGFEVKTWYEQHQNVHTGTKPYVCDICGLAFHMDRYLTAHRSSVHPQSSNLKRYVCLHCFLPCDSKKALTEHLQVHGIKTSILCDVCGKTLSNAEQLKFHMRTHLGEKPYTCSTCNKSFTKKYNLQVHRRAHGGQRAHACAQCGRRYTQRSALHRHRARHHAGTVDCVKNQKSFPPANVEIPNNL
ncbi:zinc finger protein 267 [Amyelois transitella]|uniref:zinc finger protein 267 n=1 Tax=Amyelois transitella TaxID=680683 RepID=UPI00067BE807|nr:zinc finger protein 267 [Amyelois transitella]